MSLRAIFFDVGNTLLHLDHDFVGRVSQGYGGDGAPKAVAEADAWVRDDGRWKALGVWQGYFTLLLRRLNVPEQALAAAVADIRDEHWARPYGLWTVKDPEAEAVLSALHQRQLLLGVISNADGRVAAHLRDAGLADAFAVIVDSHTVGCEKPGEAIFLAACRALAVQPNEAAYVGDIEEIDVAGSQRAGFALGILYRRGAAQTICEGRQDLPPAERVLRPFPRIGQLGQLLALV